VCCGCVGIIKPEIDKKRGKAVKNNPDYDAEYEPIEAKAFASGGCGSAWKVKRKDGSDDTIYMGKVFSGDADTVMAVFTPEAKAFELLNHPNIVKSIKTFGTGKSGDAFVIELINGMDLNAAIFRKKMFENGLPKELLLDILIQMAEAVRYMHCEAFMVHRDLHVGNWMITKDDHQIKLIDFGISQVLGKNGISKEFWVTEQY
jgi:serine/threonine protein kinase